MGSFVEQNTPAPPAKAEPAPQAEKKVADTKKGEESIVMDFQPLIKLKKRDILKMMVTGRAGVGKTRFALSAPEPVYIMETETGVAPFAEFAKDRTINVKELYKCDEHGAFDPMATLDEFENTIRYVRDKLPEGTLVVDSLTSVWQWMQDWLRYEITHAGGKINRKGVPSDRRDWAKATARHNQIMMALLSMDCHVLVTAQNHPTYDATGNELNIDKTSTQKNAPFLVDVILELDSKIVGGVTKYFGRIKKCRFPDLDIEGKIIENPTFDSVHKLIFGGNKNE